MMQDVHLKVSFKETFTKHFSLLNCICHQQIIIQKMNALLVMMCYAFPKKSIVADIPA